MYKAFSIVSVICILLVTACTHTTTNRYSDNSLQQAEHYLQLSANAASLSLSVEYRLLAADYFLQANHYEKAAKLIDNLPLANFDITSFETSYAIILLAQIDLAKQSPNIAKHNIDKIWSFNKLPTNLKIKYLNTLANIHQKNHQPLKAIQEKIRLNNYLDDKNLELANNQEIYNILMQFTPNDLYFAIKTYSSESSELIGWLKFASINKQYDSSLPQLQRALILWRTTFKEHPALAFMPNIDINNDYQLPKKIALFLPLQGAYAESANAIKNGFLTAFYNDNIDVDVKIYNTFNKNINKLYKQAVQDKTDFIVGPLLKENIKQLCKSSSLKKPTLALNTINNDSNTVKNLFQFGLTPENEAEAIANQAWNDGHRQVAIIAQQSEWGSRMQQAFIDKWQSVGGIIINSAEVKEETSDLNNKIKQILAIKHSYKRAHALRKLGFKFNFEPRVRKDIHMVFLATNSALAKQIKPLLNFYYANKLPVYASSNVYTQNKDTDLNFIKFCDMPWILDPNIRSRSTYRQIAKMWPNNFKQYARLYALGIDAYRMIFQINQLTRSPRFTISGMTGILSLDHQYKIQRQLMWAYFKNGLPRSG